MRRGIPLTDHEAITAAQPLNVDEWVWFATEQDRNLPGVGLHRIQTLLVRRGDLEISFEKDLGSSLLYPLAAPFNFWAANLYRAGEVLEICERHRENLPEPEEPSDLMGQWLRELDEKRQLRARRTTSGRYQTIQRN